MYNEGETERERPIQAASPIVSPGRGRGRPRGGGGFAGNNFLIFLFLNNFLEKSSIFENTLFFYFKEIFITFNIFFSLEIKVLEVVEVVQRAQLRLP